MQFDVLKAHIAQHYGLEVVHAESLPSYSDENIRVTVSDGTQYVWKRASSEATRAEIEAQHLAMGRIHELASAPACPVPIQAQTGSDIVVVETAGQPRLTRLLSWVEGHPLAKRTEVNDQSLYQLGAALGNVSQALRDFDHPGAHRPLVWDLSQPLQLMNQTHHIQDPQKRRVADHLFLHLESVGLGRISHLRKSVIHNDANDYNIMVGVDGQLTGLIDFGDLIFGTTASELAVPLCYIMLEQAQPLQAIMPIVQGFHEHFQLQDNEIEALWDLVIARLAISVTNSARLAANHPNPEYLTISEGPIWAMLDKLLCIPHEQATATVYAACSQVDSPPAAPDLLAARQAHLPQNLSLQTHPAMYMVRGIGPYFYSACGRKIMDLVNNVAHVGHSHPDVVRAATAQNVNLNTNSRFLHPARSEYAKRLCDTLPEHLEVCFFTCTGTEANELALRLARTYTNRRDVAVSDTAYHGHSTTMIEVSPYKCNGPGGQGPGPGVHVFPTPDPYRGRYRGSTSGPNYVAEVEAVLKEHACAALFMESLPGCGGQILPPPGFLSEAFDVARAHGAVAIADEVQVGMGRVGTHFWAFEEQEAQPDIVTIGKPIGNGHPLAAVVTSRTIANAFCNGMEYFNTFGANPVSCSIGLAVLDVIQESGLQSHAHTMGTYWLTELKKLQDQHDCIGDVRGLGLFIGIELIAKSTPPTPAPELTSAIKHHLLTEGILISIDGPQHNVLKIKPPMVIGRPEIDRVNRALDSALQIYGKAHTL